MRRMMTPTHTLLNQRRVGKASSGGSVLDALPPVSFVGTWYRAPHGAMLLQDAQNRTYLNLRMLVSEQQRGGSRRAADVSLDRRDRCRALLRSARTGRAAHGYAEHSEVISGHAGQQKTTRGIIEPQRDLTFGTRSARARGLRNYRARAGSGICLGNLSGDRISRSARNQRGAVAERRAQRCARQFDFDCGVADRTWHVFSDCDFQQPRWSGALPNRCGDFLRAAAVNPQTSRSDLTTANCRRGITGLRL